CLELALVPVEELVADVLPHGHEQRLARREVTEERSLRHARARADALHARLGVALLDEHVRRRVEELADRPLPSLLLRAALLRSRGRGIRTARRHHAAFRARSSARGGSPPAGRNAPYPSSWPSAGSTVPSWKATRPFTRTSRTAPSLRFTMRIN